jgi:CRISPR-associated endoribonuclease Cas6
VHVIRLHFSLSPNQKPVDFNYHTFLTTALHRWLGHDNPYHDALSLYSVGSLQGGGARNNALQFPRGASWHLSAPDTPQGQELLQKIAEAALHSPDVAFGMEVIEISSQSTPEFGPKRVFRADSPIFIRGEKEDDKDPHILFDHPRASDYLTRTLHHKLDKAGLGHLSEGTRVSFDSTYKTPKTRLIHIKDDFYKRASVCPVIVEGKPEAVRFAWNTGAGNLTGSGFGSLI